MESRELERRQVSGYDPYIRVPSDLFGERLNRRAPSVQLPMPYSGRSAGIYPPPRPLLHPQPWTLQIRRREGPKKSDESYPPLERLSCRPFLNSEPSLSLDSVNGRRHHRRRCGYRRPGMWQQQQSVPHHVSVPSLMCPLVRRHRGIT